MRTPKSECSNANLSTIAANPGPAYWDNPTSTDPLTDFCRGISPRIPFKRLAVYIKANGIMLVFYGKQKIVSAFGQSLPEAILRLSLKIGS